MSREYAENRIKEAIKRAGGNPTRARQQIIAWTYEDTKLLHALTKSHLTGIVAYNIDRILSGRGDKSGSDTESAGKKQPKKAAEAGKDNFGMEILKAVAGNSGAAFGMDAYGSAGSKKSKVSQSHVEALRLLASKSKSKT